MYLEKYSGTKLLTVTLGSGCVLRPILYFYSEDPQRFIDCNGQQQQQDEDHDGSDDGDDDGSDNDDDDGDDDDNDDDAKEEEEGLSSLETSFIDVEPRFPGDQSKTHRHHFSSFFSTVIFPPPPPYSPPPATLMSSGNISRSLH